MSRWVEELEQAARARLSSATFRYFSQGAGAGLSAQEATSAWRALRFRPHALTDVTDVRTQTSLLGSAVSAPLAIAPTTLQRQAHPEGELAVCRAAAQSGSLVVASSNAGTTYAEIAATGAHWWAQIYVLRERSLTAELVAAAVQAGAEALVLTADTPVVGSKDDGPGPTVWDEVPADYLHANLDTRGRGHQDFAKATDVTTDTLRWLGEISGLPVVVKGLLRADDANRAVAGGAAAVWVSNHGGRQLDRSLTTCAALPEVVRAVASQVEVYVDGGLRDGNDLLAAMASGARAVFIGRPVLWALTVDGSAGVQRLLGELTAELREAMMLAGVTDVAHVAEDLLVHPRSV